jgi:hypothetical protein
MPVTTVSRPLTDAERRELQRMSRPIPGHLGKVQMALFSFLLLWAASLLGAIVLWLVLAAVAKAALGLSCGWDSPYRLVVVFCCALACAVYSAGYHYRWIKGFKSSTVAIQSDLANGAAQEEIYEFTDVKRFQEQEDGGLLYFLKSSTGKAYVLFDSESQDLGARGEDPMNSSFVPRAQLRVVRAQNSRRVLSSEFLGPNLALSTPLDLLAPPSAWPEQDEYCQVPWAELEGRFSKALLRR